MSTRAAVLLVLLAVAPIASCGGTGTTGGSAPPNTPGPSAVPGWPISIVAIGHSGLTGYYSGDESQPDDVLTNSWATGTNPAVDSVYLRVLAENPAVAGRNANLAVDGSDVDGLLRQAPQALAVTPPPDLIIVQSIDNDMRCDGTDAAHEPVYRAKLTEVMDLLTAGAPDATIFFVSQWADVETYSKAVFAVAPEHLSGDGPCDVVDPATGRLVKARMAVEQQLVDEYFAIVTSVCAEYAHCRTDGGAMQRLPLAPADLAPDYNHLSVPGLHAMAQAAFHSLYG